MRTRLLILTMGAALAAAPTFAQDRAPADDPPSRAARLSFLSGTVSFQPGGVEDWAPATLNRPLTTGDRIWTEDGARAEMHIGSAAFRLNGRTNFAFTNLDDRTAQVQISIGVLSVRLRRLNEDETFEIDTPQVAFSLLRPGEYRVEVNEQGDGTIVTVRGGDGEATAEGQAFPIHAREQVRISGSADGATPAFDRRSAPPGDGFDNFCEGRDRQEDLSVSARYVSRDMPGYADLDRSGVWRDYPDYGPVWVPGGVPAGWAPYRYGHWAWIAPWGWTWVDDAPWGYAPFHYGRWAFVGGAWGWVPGPLAVRPVYAPALVAWVGGPSFAVGVSIGGPPVGWFPLGPREVFVPSYRYSPRYIEQVNVTNTVIVNRTVINNVNVTNVNYMNRNVAGAVTVVPQGAMASGRPIAAAAVQVPSSAVARAQVTSVASVAPERTAVFSGRAPGANAPPQAIANRTVVARAAPPSAPVPFAQRQSVLRANPGRPVDAGTLRTLQSAAPPPVRPAYRPAGAQPPVTRPAAALNPAPQPPALIPPRPENRPLPAPTRPQVATPPAAPQAAPRSVQPEQRRGAPPPNQQKQQRRQDKREEKDKQRER